MKRLIFKKEDLSQLPPVPEGYVTLGVSSDGSLSTITDGGTVSAVGGSGGGSTSGTYYEYVSANGTDTENAAELQAAYTTAKSKVVIESTPISINSSFIYVSSGSLMSFFDSPSLAGVSLVNGQTYTIILDGTEYTGVVVYYSDFDISMSSVTAPDDFYSTFSIVASTTKKAKVVASPGYYNFASDFIADDGNVDIVSLDGNRSVIFNGDGTINVTGDGAYIKGIDVQDKNFTIADDLPNITIVNCKGGDYSFGGDSTGTNPITVSGTFIDCESGDSSFGYRGIASGHFERCKATGYSFGDSATANGTFINCEITGKPNAGTPMGGFGSIADGYFENCKGGYSSFGKYLGSSAGTFINCVGRSLSFQGNCSGVYTNCDAGGQDSFAYGKIASGIFTNCVAGKRSFGGNTSGGTIGQLTGKLYYCRLTSETFQTVSGGGITRYCIDGNHATNNQG